MLHESALPTLTTWSLLKPFATSTSKNDSTCASRQDHRCKVGYRGAAGGGDNAFSWWGAPPRRRVRRLLPSCGPAQSTSAVQRSGRDVLHPLVPQISLVELTRAVYWCCANLTFNRIGTPPAVKHWLQEMAAQAGRHTRTCTSRNKRHYLLGAGAAHAMARWRREQRLRIWCKHVPQCRMPQCQMWCQDCTAGRRVCCMSDKTPTPTPSDVRSVRLKFSCALLQQHTLSHIDQHTRRRAAC